MRTLDDEMAFVDQAGVLLCRTAPQDESDMRQFIHALNDSRRELLPAFFAMRMSLVSTDRQDRVQQKDSLSRPGFKAASFRRGNIKITLKLFENVSQRRRQPDSRLHRKTQAMCLSGIVIRVLPKNDNANLVQRGQTKRIEHIRFGWKNNLVLTFLRKELLQSQKVRLFEFVVKAGPPGTW